MRCVSEAPGPNLVRIDLLARLFYFILLFALHFLSTLIYLKVTSSRAIRPAERSSCLESLSQKARDSLQTKREKQIYISNFVFNLIEIKLRNKKVAFHVTK